MRSKSQALIQVSTLIAIIVLINVVSSKLYQRFDLTKEKRFTLTNATQALLEDLDDVVYVQVYLEGEFPAGFKRLRNATLEMLDEFRAYSGNMLEYQFIDPFENAATPKERQTIAQELMDKGLSPTRLMETQDGYSEKILFPGAIMRYKGRELPVILLQEQLNKGPQETLNNSIALLEYNLANGIQKMQRTKKPAIAFIEGQGELPKENVRDLAAYLSQYYYLERINLNENLFIPEQFSVAIVAKPTTAFKETNKFKLDQYIMNGGRVLWLLENLRAELDSLNNKEGSFLALDYGLNLEDQLFKYGARVNFDIVRDLQSTQVPFSVGSDKYGNSTQLAPFRWDYFPVITNANPAHPVTKSLDAVVLRFAGSIDTIRTKSANIKKTILLSTSKYSKKVPSPIRISADGVRSNPNPADYSQSNIPVAVALEGEFVSPFKNRLAGETLKIIESLEGISFKEKSSPTKMVIIADGDIAKNDFNPASGKSAPLGYYKYTRETFANKELLINAIEWLGDEYGIIAARSKDVKLRLLDEQKIKDEQVQWQLINLILPLGLVLVFGSIYNYHRRRKYAQ